MLTLMNGRPRNEEGRLEKEIKCYDLLDRLGIPYQRLDHWPADSMEVCGEIDKSLNAVICKNLFLCNRQETAFYLLLIPGNKPFKTKYLSAQLGVSRLSFGKEEYMERFLDNTPGSATVLGLMNDHENRVQLVIDRDVFRHEYFGCHPCINTSSLRLRLSDVMEKLLPAIHHEAVLVELPWEEEAPCTNQ
ncbi:MAG: prolyl-tRNA synthetase associated domain-containing protein [Firmicutes bacterium]|nr:prolyl-tRNA synthetase associated domain-containing protein [Bacillota bacterium]MDY4222676.1 prolyl-tRNA synthetase associated domain-containing protein [Candidatus Faecousia sp.]MDY6161550.1 prolyl-tRNA synthetase associated domain-containing protein [Candidatus Faecousia sp.]